jgi:site-specific DNA-methyltransferase (adenine-specific)
MENFVNKIINGDCIEVMKTMPESIVDLIVTSPPYGVGIEYDTHNDDVDFEEYKIFSKDWLSEAYRVLKDDGRIALNIPYEIKAEEFLWFLNYGQSCKRLVISSTDWST